MEFLFKLQLFIFFENSLPFCLDPTFNTGTLNDGDSIIALEEFPNTILENFIIFK